MEVPILPIPPILPILPILLVLLVLLVVAVAQWSLPPLPRGVKHVRGLQLVGSAVAMGRDGAALLARHGPVFAMYMLRRPTLVLTQHADILAVSKQPRVFSAEPVQAAFAEAVCGTKASASLEVTDSFIHSLWARHLGGAGLNPSTTVAARRLVRELSGVRGSYLSDAVAAGATTGPSDWTVVPRWYDLVFRVLFAAGFPAVMGAGMETRPLVDAMRVLDDHVPLMVAGLPKIVTSKGFTALDAIAEAFHQHLVAAGLWTQDEPDILRNADGELALSGLQMDRSKHFRDSGVYTVRDIASVSVMIAWALQTNTAPGAFWTIVHLLTSPAALATVRAEVDAVAAAHPTFPLDLPASDGVEAPGGGGSVNASTMYDKLFPVLTAATWESLRLATAPMIAREVTAACDITLPSTGETCSLQPGDSVYMVPTQHWDASVFSDPSKYDHTRFLAKAAGDATKPRTPSMVFGTGAHMCPGRFLAMNEIRAFVFVLLRDWDLELVAAEVPAFDRTRFGLGVMPPAREMPVKIRRRHRPSSS